VTAVACRHAVPREAPADRLRRFFSPVLAWLADTRHALRTPPPPRLAVAVSAESHGTIRREDAPGRPPWDTVTTELPALTDDVIAAIEAGAA